MSDFQITIERDVPIPDGETRGGVHAKYKDKLVSMKIGDSFFLENTTKEEIANLIRYAKRLGVHLLARDFDEDPDYLAPGVRAWRVQQEVLPGRKPNTPSKSLFDTPAAEEVDEHLYWHHRRDKLVLRDLMTATPPKGFVQIDKAKYQSLLAQGEVFEARPADKIVDAVLENVYSNDTYWYHAESDSFWMSRAGETIPVNADAAVSIEVREELYITGCFVNQICAETDIAYLMINEEKRKAVIWAYDRNVQPLIDEGYRKTDTLEFSEALLQWYNEPHFWRSPTTGLPLMCEPGYRNIPTFHGGWEQLTEHEYQCEAITAAPDYDTYWRRGDGSCTVVPPEKYGKARKTKGAVQISKRVFDQWTEENSEEL